MPVFERTKPVTRPELSYKLLQGDCDGPRWCFQWLSGQRDQGTITLSVKYGDLNKALALLNKPLRREKRNLSALRRTGHNSELAGEHPLGDPKTPKP